MRRRLPMVVVLSLLAAAPACAPDVSSVGAVFTTGEGLVAEYFDRRDFERPSGLYEDTNIDFEGWELNETIQSRGHVARTVSIVWTGQIWLEQPESYTLYFELRGRVRVWVDDTRIIDDWRDGWDLREAQGSVAATGGGWRKLRIEWDQFAGPMTARLRYASTSQPKAIVPADDLRHPD
jgi:hypothetical protein